jgi:hypothetical protein
MFQFDFSYFIFKNAIVATTHDAYKKMSKLLLTTNNYQTMDNHKVIFLKPSIPHFRALTKSRPTTL